MLGLAYLWIFVESREDSVFTRGTSPGGRGWQMLETSIVRLKETDFIIFCVPEITSSTVVCIWPSLNYCVNYNNKFCASLYNVVWLSLYQPNSQALNRKCTQYLGKPVCVPCCPHWAYILRTISHDVWASVFVTFFQKEVADISVVASPCVSM
jgi:hypothetical protein